jgi:CRP-like cAMP-binding protein
MATSRNQLRDLLQDSELFEAIDDAGLDRLVEIASEQPYAAGEVVFTRGQPARALFAVLSGQLKAVSTAADGREIVLRLLDPGTILGEIAVLDGGARTATVVASEKSLLASVDRRDLLDLMRASPDIALNLLTVLASRLRSTTAQVEETNFLLLPARLARRLLALADEYGEAGPTAGEIKLRLSQEELGQLVATSRVSINQQLKAWEAEGAVRTSRGAVTLLDLAVLEAAAAG